MCFCGNKSHWLPKCNFNWCSLALLACDSALWIATSVFSLLSFQSITEWLRLEGTSGRLLVQPPCQSRSPRALDCIQKNFEYLQRWRPWAIHSSALTLTVKLYLYKELCREYTGIYMETAQREVHEKYVGFRKE